MPPRSARCAAPTARARLAGGDGAGFAFPAGGSVVRVAHQRAGPGGVELRGVSLLGGRVQARRVVVPAHGVAGAVVSGLRVAGRPVQAGPNTLVPLGGGSYLVALQEAVTPTRSSAVGVGVVGLRLHLGAAVAGLPAGSELWLAPASAARRPASASRPARSPRGGWTVLGLERLHRAPADLATFAPPQATATGREAAALAVEQVGVPYVWGGAAPLGGFDCSGLVAWAYGQVGVPLPHYAAAQYRSGVRLEPDQLRPGDLVFFSPAADGPGHVGLYVGAGQFVEAPDAGGVVRLASLSAALGSRRYVGAARPYGR